MCHMHCIRKIWMPKLKRSPSPSPTSQSGKDMEDGNDDLCSNPSVDEEYTEVLRTKSYTEIASKVEEQLMSKLALDSRFSLSSTPTSLPMYIHQSECLLETSQQTAMDMVQSSTIHTLLMDFFNSSLDACHLCELLLHGIHRTRFNYRYIQRAIKITNGENHHSQEAMIAKDFTSFSSLSNPLSIISTEQFKDIHERFSLLLNHLTSKSRKTERKMKYARFCKKALGCGSVASYSVLAVALPIPAVRGIIGQMSDSFGVSREIVNRGQVGPKMVCEQLDVAARGVYILINQLDTMNRLVDRLDDEVRHNISVAEMCVRSYTRRQEVPREAVKQLEVHEDGFLEQLDELLKHICFCFLSVNRSRRLVIEEIMVSMNS